MRRPLLPLCALVAFAAAAPGCKVGLTDIAAAFSTADAAWFAEEETLFVFYEVAAQQGLGVETVVELTYTTDDGIVDWTAIDALPKVHTHLPVDCGPDTRCGSTSLHVPQEPRDVRLRLRYHRDGALTLDPETRLNIVGRGPAHSHRSLLVYGVFDADNRAIQWRARHRFPTLRNEEVEHLGLRRRFVIEAIGHAPASPDPGENPYLYGADCPGRAPLDWSAVETEARAVFSPEDLPVEAFDAAIACARSTVFDPTGPFEATAIARKNPEVGPAFPLLRSPVREATPIKYLLAICDRTISATHRTMQRQRLLMSGVEPVCIDDLAEPEMADALVAELRARFRRDLETVRAGGRDMILALALHHDDRALSATIERAIEPLLTAERARNTPRLAGAFVFDSYAYEVTDADVGAAAIWCPSTVDLDLEGDEDADAGLPLPTGIASLGCVVPDIPLNFTLGPFDLGGLPILPTRAQYLAFLDTYSEDQAGSMLSLRFHAPELPPDAEHLALPPFAIATFFNDEIITAEPDDGFSYCETEGEYAGAVFRSASSPLVMPIALLPEWHAQTGEATYALGLVYEFPYLLEMRYEAVAAIGVTAFGATLPFGIGADVDQDFGSTVWRTGEFPLAQTLTRCRRYCDHPTFDAAGVYQVGDLFTEAYRNACYRPDFPARGDPGFPRDP